MLYPNAYKEMEPERLLMVEGSKEQKKEAWKILAVAYRVIPDIAEDDEFTDPLLNELVGKWIDPGQKNIREIVLDLTPLLCQKELSMDGLKDTLEAYAFQKLQFHQARLKKLTLQQLNTVNEAINDLVWGAFSDEDNSVAKSLEFLVHRRLIKIDVEINNLRKEQERLDNPDPGRASALAIDPQIHERERNRVENRIKELEELRAKLSTVNTGG